MEHQIKIHGHTAPVTSDGQIMLNDTTIAQLLGISLSEYCSLEHMPLEASRNQEGKIQAFFIRFSTNNNKRLLCKLDMDKNNMVTFKFEEVSKLFAGVSGGTAKRI